MIHPPVETIRISEEAKANLLVLKRRTGISQWNILCRWAVCASLADSKPVVATPKGEQSNVEIAWSTFGGQHADVYTSLIHARCHQDRLGNDSHTLAEQFRLHLERGLLKLRSREDTRSLEGLLSLVDNGLAGTSSNGASF